MLKFIKNILKKYFISFKIRDRLSPQTQILLRNTYLNHKQNISEKYYPKLSETGFRVFSQFEEDGLLLYVFSAIGMTNKTFVEIGSDDGINSNCANLAYHFKWDGLFIDGNKSAIERGERFYRKNPHPWGSKPKFEHSLVKRENINSLIKEAGFQDEIGLLSIDIDGNDYWIWDAIEVIEPQVVIIETHIEFGFHNIVVPYDPDYFYPGKHPVYHGASPIAMNKLANKKGYRLVGANELGFNFIFVKNNLATETLPEVSVESVLQHPSAIESQKLYEQVKDFEFVSPIL